MSRVYPEWAFKTSPEDLLKGMGFSIIYEADCPADHWIRKYMPDAKLRRNFITTEEDEQYEYSYLGGNWKKGKHRKICGILTYEEFKSFLFQTGLWADDIETMGSIGAPGFDCGWAPAISFRNDDPEVIQSAYVTPLPFFEDEEMQKKIAANSEEADTVWWILRNVIIREFGIEEWKVL